MSETPAETPVETPVEAPAPVPAPAPEPAPEPAAAPAGNSEVAKLIEEARAHLSGGIPLSAVEKVIRAVEILAGL